MLESLILETKFDDGLKDNTVVIHYILYGSFEIVPVSLICFIAFS